jgi:hypothetical protein
MRKLVVGVMLMMSSAGPGGSEQAVAELKRSAKIDHGARHRTPPRRRTEHRRAGRQNSAHRPHRRASSLPTEGTLASFIDLTDYFGIYDRF